MKVQYLWCWTLSSVSVCRQGYPSTPIPPLGPSPCRPLGTTTGVLPRRKNFPTHGPWDRDRSVPGHRKWSGCKKNPGNNGMQGVQRCAEVCGRVCRWAWSPGGGRVGQSGCTCMCKSWKMKSGCGGHIESTPPIGKVVPLGLVCDEKVLQDGWQGWTDMSKCGNVAGFRTHAHAHAQSAGGRWEGVAGT